MNRLFEMKKYLLTILASLLVLVVPIYADEDIPSEGVTYTLTYPDGSVVTTDSYEEVQELLKEENWKKIGEGFTSDKDGNAYLPEEWISGTVKIVESKVPSGYSQGDKEKIVDLEEGEVTFVNPKSTPPNVPYQIPTTGVEEERNIVLGISVLAICSMIYLSFKKDDQE